MINAPNVKNGKSYRNGSLIMLARDELQSPSFSFCACGYMWLSVCVCGCLSPRPDAKVKQI